VVFAILVSACGTVDPSSRAPTTHPSVPEATAEPTVLPSLSPDCAAIEQNGGPRLDIELQMPNGRGQIFTQIVAERALDGRAVAVPQLGVPGVEDFGHVQGGIELPGTVNQDQALSQVQGLSITGVLTIAGGSASVALPIRLVGSAVVLTFPDIDATVTFGLELTYRDDCFAYEAAARVAARLGSIATVAACPIGDGFVPYVVELAKSPISVGGARTKLEITGYAPRWSLGASSTDGPPLAEWDRAIPPIAADRGARLDIVNRNRDLTIDEVTVEIYRRADVMRDYVNAEPIADAAVVALADGRLDIRAPLEPGRYVVALFSSWTAACATGGALSVVAVDVT
jgi:hypothetical protein